LPFWLDKTELNGYDRQSQNGYFTRIVLLGMLGGHFGADFQAEPKNISDGPPLVEPSDFMQEIIPSDRISETTNNTVTIPLEKGIVLEQVAEGSDVQQVWKVIYMIRSILKFHGVGSQGVQKSTTNPEKFSGFLTVPDLDISLWGQENLQKLAALAPGSILKDFADNPVRKTFRLSLPPAIYKVPEISCTNEACISNPKNGQREVFSHFERIPGPGFRYACKYCEAPHGHLQLWEWCLDRSMGQ